MKKISKKIFVFGLPLLYCLATSFYLANFFNPSNSAEFHNETENGYRYATVSSGSIGQIAHAENSIRFSPNPPIPIAKTQVNENAAWFRSGEFLGAVFFTQYAFFVKNCLIRFRHTDLIFPFHFFW